MKLITGLTAAALSGLALGASPRSAESDVYILQPSSAQSPADTPSIPKEVARHILLQRTSRQQYGSDLRDIPDSIDTETAIDYIARFGKSPAPLFAQAEKPGAAQLAVILEGTSSAQSDQLREKLGQHAAFTISDSPSATANNNLMAFFRNLGVASPQQCELSAAIDPFRSDCWTGSSSVVKYDLQKTPDTLDNLLDSLPQIQDFVADGELEVVLVVMPESSRASPHKHWSASATAAERSASNLRRWREPEAVLSNIEFNDQTPNPNTFANRAKPIPQCFPSFNSCMERTGNCSNHGECVNKYGGGTGEEGGASCFACACKPSVMRGGAADRGGGRKTVHWGGNMCQKEDISVQFWLIAGFTITIVGAITFAVGLLFKVGEEPLPGVIGAGVSRSK